MDAIDITGKPHSNNNLRQPMLYKTVQEKYNYGGPMEREYIEKERLYAYDITSKTIAEITPSISTI